MSHLDLFDPFADGPEPDDFRSKMLLELISMCMYYRRCVGANYDPRVPNFVSFVHDVWQQPTFRERVWRYPERLRLYGMTYISLLQCGTGERSYREVIQRIVDQGYATGVELVPFRGLDLRHMLDSGGFKHDIPSYAHLYQQTLLAKSPPLLYATDYDVYCITHTLYYLADFGFRPIDVIPEEQLSTVRWIVGTLLGMYLRSKNWDLVAELLLACRCLRWAPRVVFDAAWDALLDAQAPDGSLSGPNFSEEEMRQLNQSEQRNYHFEQNYHTTLVGALAAFLSNEWIANLEVSPT